MCEANRYRPNVGIVVIDSRGHVLLGQRHDVMFPNWQFPQGGIESGEDLYTAAVRELYEETGITTGRIINKTDTWVYYNFPQRKPLSFFKGQKQKWVLWRYTDTPQLRESSEFIKFMWKAPQDIFFFVPSFRHYIYKVVLQKFGVLCL